MLVDSDRAAFFEPLAGVIFLGTPQRDPSATVSIASFFAAMASEFHSSFADAEPSTLEQANQYMTQVIDDFFELWRKQKPSCSLCTFSEQLQLTLNVVVAHQTINV